MTPRRAGDGDRAKEPAPWHYGVAPASKARRSFCVSPASRRATHAARADDRRVWRRQRERRIDVTSIHSRKPRVHDVDW
jgi:hypothetical protein